MPGANVIIIQRIFTSYRKAFFEALSSRLDILLLHGINQSGIPQTKAPFANQVQTIRYGKKESSVFLNVFGNIITHRPKVIVHESGLGILSLPFTFLLAKVMRTKFVIWGHGFNREKGFDPKRSFESRLRYFYMKNSDAYIVYGNRAKETLSAYLPPSKIFVAQNTLDIKHLTAIRDNFEVTGKAFVKEKIGLKHEYNLVFIGRLVRSKRPEMVLDVLSQLIDKDIDVGAQFIGDGEMFEELQQLAKQKQLSNRITFYGSIHDDIKTGEILFASDLMIMPGYLGLSVNHSFCFDTPVMSLVQKANGPFHSPEVEYVVQGKTGFLVEEHTAKAMANTVEVYLKSEEDQLLIKKAIRHMVENVITLEKMVNGFEECIAYCNQR